jgi:hypothetical protein
MDIETSTATPAAAIADGIGEAWSRFLARSARPQSPHPYVYASAFRTCDRRAALELTVPDQQPPFSPELLAKFRRGDDRERDLLADLTRIGRDSEPSFKVISQQERFTLRDHKARTAIVGKVDARLEVAGARPPLEVKAWSPLMTDRIERFADLFENPWTQAGAHQLLAYLFAAGEPYGFLLLDRSGLPKLIPVELEPNLERVEDFLAKAERVLDHVDAGTLPDYLAGEPDECRRCPFYGGTCNPPLESTGVATILAEPELEAALERREAIKAIGKEYADLDKEIKDRLRGVTHGIAGKFSITGRWGKQSRLELPAALKTQYTKTDPHGRFTLEITKL